MITRKLSFRNRSSDFNPLANALFEDLLDLLLPFLLISGIIGSLIFIVFSFGYREGVEYSLSMLPEQPMIKLSEPKKAEPETKPETITGIASWYDYSLNGVAWSKDHNTAASRRFERYTHVKVTNPDNGTSVVVYINDFGPEEQTGREIDLSSHAFAQLAPLSAGIINVYVEPYDAIEI